MTRFMAVHPGRKETLDSVTLVPSNFGEFDAFSRQSVLYFVNARVNVVSVTLLFERIQL